VTAIVEWAKGALRLSSAPFTAGMLAVGAVLLILRPRWGRRWMIGLAILFWVCATPIGSELLARPLARGFHRIEHQHEAAGVEAIVVLGGGSYQANAGSIRLGYPSNETASRVVEAARVFRLLGGQPLIIVSGGTYGKQTVPEAEVMAAILAQLQAPPDRILLETLSKTTREQAIAVTQLLKARGIGRVVLVTAPTHMLRASLVFRAQGANVIPSTAPIDSSMLNDRFSYLPNQDALELSDEAVYDYASIAYYWSRGWFRASPEAAR
jgi:uncharacterized SAM-binding protein YcdF (DUF218 family)